MTIFRACRYIIALLLLLLLAACVEREEAVGEKAEPPRESAGTAVPIADVLKDPAAWKGKVVTVRGRAEPGLAFQFVNEQPFRLRDGSGEIWVITTGEMPGGEEPVTVRGRVTVPYQIKGHHYEVVLLERERQP